MVHLNGLAQLFWENREVQERLKGNDLAQLVACLDDAKVALKDLEHAWLNRRLLKPIVLMMRDQKTLWAPSKVEIDIQLRLLAFKLDGRKRGEDVETYEINESNIQTVSFSDTMETDIFCAVSGLKPLIRFLRKAYLRPHVPRDRVWRMCVCVLFKENNHKLLCECFWHFLTLYVFEFLERMQHPNHDHNPWKQKIHKAIEAS